MFFYTIYCIFRSCKANFVKIFNNSNVNDERQGRDKNGLVKKICGSEDFFEMDVFGSNGVTLQFRY